MVDFAYVVCPRCSRHFMAHHEFFRIPGAYCHCPFCATEFGVQEPAATTQASAVPDREHSSPKS